MAKRREIQFSIDDEGNVSIEVKGVAGAECERITREIEEALGIVTSREKTSEFYIQAETTEKATLDNG
ncbi:MAG: hypothetical protein RIT45_957 [Pseudomonadota bacterium]|jgi:hypothetical protein